MNNKEEKKSLFAEFPPISTQEWEAKIEKDLKGADRSRKLVWHTNEGLNIEPYYRLEDIENLPQTNSLPGKYPYLRGNKSMDNNWEIRQDILVEDFEEANKKAVKAVKGGAEALNLKISILNSASDFESLLKGIDITKIAIHFSSCRSYPEFLAFFATYADKNQIKKNEIKGSIQYDPLAFYFVTGEFYETWEKNTDELISLSEKYADVFPLMKLIHVDASIFHNAGSSIIQELAFGLASANEYLNALSEKGIDVEPFTQKMQLKVALGSDYFLEIAKIRAIRVLWANMLKSYELDCSCNSKIHIHGETSKWNKSIYDPYVNMLRTTTEAMEGAIAGLDSMTIGHFSSSYQKSDEFSDRMARNQQLVLKEEAYFDKVADPSAGSYYVETLTHEIAEKTWELFLEIENMGGIIEAYKTNFINEEISKSCQKKDLDIATRKLKILGTNIFPNANETMLDKLVSTEKSSYPKGLQFYRAAESFENLRFATEKYINKGNQRPKVFLLTIGNLTMRKARASFANNFFACAGYEIIDNNGFKTIAEGIEAAKAINSQIIVLCSSDDEYEVFAKEAKQLLNDNMHLVIAGNPACKKALENEGINDFIHVKTNVLLFLNDFHKKLSI